MSKQKSDPITWGEEIFRYKQIPKESIIDGILYDKDIIVITGAPKAGKSILAQQIAMSLAGPTNKFLDHKGVHRSGDILYFQAEGDYGEMMGRIKDMEKALEVDRSSVYHYFKPGTFLNTEKGWADFTTNLDSCEHRTDANFELIIIDPIYKAFAGDLCDQKVATQISTIVDKLRYRYDCSVLLLHHTTKETFDSRGNPIDRGDGTSYGSQFLKAMVDAMFMLKKHGEKRVLTCSTSRSGKHSPYEEFFLVTPEQDPSNPFIFSASEVATPTLAKRIENLLSKEQVEMGWSDIQSKIGGSKSNISKQLTWLVEKGVITKRKSGRNIYYKIREQTKPASPS